MFEFQGNMVHHLVRVDFFAADLFHRKMLQGYRELIVDLSFICFVESNIVQEPSDNTSPGNSQAYGSSQVHSDAGTRSSLLNLSGVSDSANFRRWGWHVAWLTGLVMLIACNVFSSGLALGQNLQEEEFVPEGRYLLRWKFQPGQEFEVHVDQSTTTQTTSTLMKSGKLPVRMNLYQDWMVEESEGKLIVILQTFTRVKMQMSYPVVGEIFVDTDAEAPQSPVANKVYQNLKALVGRAMRMKMTRLGEVKSYKLVDDPSLTAEDAMGRLLSKDALSKLSGEMVKFPLQSIQPGYQWTEAPKFLPKEPGMEAKVTSEYKFLGPNAQQPELANISVTPVLEIASEKDQVMIESQENIGAIVYNLKELRVVETSLTQKMVLNIKAEPPIKRTIDTTLKMTIQIKNPEAQPSEESKPKLETGADEAPSPTDKN